MRLPQGLTLFAVALPCLSCADHTPATIAFTAPPPIVASGRIIRLDASVANKKGETIAGVPVTASAAPSDVLEVTSGGGLRCLKTGDATLTLAGGGLSTPVPVKCRIPTEIDVPQEMQLILGSAPSPLHARVLGEDGHELKDVPVQLSSSDPSVAAVVGDRLKPVAVGRARLRAAVEEIAGVTAVEVDERIVTEPLRLATGASRSFKLQPADYLVAVDVKADFKANQGVTVTWEGAACESQPERQSHRVRCRVNEPATVTVANPKRLGLGAAMTGSVAIFRVPSPQMPSP